MKQTKSVGSPSPVRALPTNRTFFYRARVIYGELTEGAKNATQLAKLLEVSTKTIHRDLEYMRDMLGIEMEWNASAHGYKLAAGVHMCAVCASCCKGSNPLPSSMEAKKSIPNILTACA